MLWQIITCDNSRHILQAQKYLLDKYAPNIKIHYIDLGSEPIETWTLNVLKRLDTSEPYTILGLDDFLPIDYLPDITLPDHDFNRIEMSHDSWKKGKEITGNYTVSCQFSIWKTSKLIELLSKPMSPWQFEKNLKLDKVYTLPKPFRYIEESAISGRQKGKVNLCGLRQSDIDELIDLKLVNKEDIIYSWRGNHERKPETYQGKYHDYL